MTDKQIIIDGVDVNKYQHYTGNVEYLNREWTCRVAIIGTKCEENPNCYFKQLARAKDKINYMEEYIKTVENARNDIERELKRKEQKLEKIKDYCLKNKVAGWVDIEGIIEIIEGKENEK